MQTPSIKFIIELILLLPNGEEKAVGTTSKYGAVEARIWLKEFGVDISESRLYRAHEKQIYQAKEIPWLLEDHPLLNEAVDQHVSFIRT